MMTLRKNIRKKRGIFDPKLDPKKKGEGKFTKDVVYFFLKEKGWW